MRRSGVAASVSFVGRSCLRLVSTRLLNPVVNGSCTRFPAALASSRDCRHVSHVPPGCGKFIGTSSSLERRSEVILARTPNLRRTEMSTIIASLDRFDPSSNFSTSNPHRACCHEQRCSHTSERDFEGKEKISVTFVTKNGEEKTIQVLVGKSMLEAAHENDIELEGACEGSLACSTCHVIVMDENLYSQLPEPTDEENDMLDLAFGLTEMSRLGCQVIATPELNGLRLALPAATRNFAVDGHVPKPH